MKHIQLYEADQKTLSWNELGPEAKAHAIEAHRHINVDDDSWHDIVLEDIEDELKEEGWNHVVVQYSGFFSQGDGASFTGVLTSDGVRRFIRELGIDVPDEIADWYVIQSTRNSARYSHERTVDLEVGYDSDEDVIELFPVGMEIPFRYDLKEIRDRIEEEGSEWLVDRCRAIYRQLEDEWDRQTSDEAVEDTLIANGYEWDKKGNIV